MRQKVEEGQMDESRSGALPKWLGRMVGVKDENASDLDEKLVRENI